MVVVPEKCRRGDRLRRDIQTCVRVSAGEPSRLRAGGRAAHEGQPSMCLGQRSRLCAREKQWKGKDNTDAGTFQEGRQKHRNTGTPVWGLLGGLGSI